MDKDEFKQLKEGDIIRHLKTRNPYVVLDNHGNGVRAIHCVFITRNPWEWAKINKDQGTDCWRPRRRPFSVEKGGTMKTPAAAVTHAWTRISLRYPKRVFVGFNCNPPASENGR